MFKDVANRLPEFAEYFHVPIGTWGAEQLSSAISYILRWWMPPHYGSFNWHLQAEIDCLCSGEFRARAFAVGVPDDALDQARLWYA